MEGKKKTQMLLKASWVKVQQQDNWELQLITSWSKKLHKQTSQLCFTQSIEGHQDSEQIWKFGLKMITIPASNDASQKELCFWETH